MVLRLRRAYRLAAAEIAGKLQIARSTVAAHLDTSGNLVPGAAIG